MVENEFIESISNKYAAKNTNERVKREGALRSIDGKVSFGYFFCKFEEVSYPLSWGQERLCRDGTLLEQCRCHQLESRS